MWDSCFTLKLIQYLIFVTVCAAGHASSTIPPIKNKKHAWFKLGCSLFQSSHYVPTGTTRTLRLEFQFAEEGKDYAGAAKSLPETPPDVTTPTVWPWDTTGVPGSHSPGHTSEGFENCGLLDYKSLKEHLILVRNPNLICSDWLVKAGSIFQEICTESSEKETSTV